MSQEVLIGVVVLGSLIGLAIQWAIIKSAVQAGVVGAARQQAEGISETRRRFERELIPAIAKATRAKVREKAARRALAELASARAAYGVVAAAMLDEIEAEVQDAAGSAVSA